MITLSLIVTFERYWVTYFKEKNWWPLILMWSNPVEIDNMHIYAY